jgi:hypothetical protein
MASRRDNPTIQLSLTERRLRVRQMKSEGWRIWRIAQELGVHRRTVERDIAWVLERDREELALQSAEMLRQELDVLYAVNCEAWRGWEKSMQPICKEFAGTEDAGSGGVRRSRFERTTMTTAGDPRFLHLILEASDRRAKLLGLYDLKEEEPKRPQYNEQAVKQALASLTDEQLEAVCTFQERVATFSGDRPTHAAGAHSGSGRTIGECPPGPAADGGPDPFGPDPIPLCDVGRLSAGRDPVDLQPSNP